VPDGVAATASDGNLALTGTVPYGSQRAAAESAVAGLTGVRNAHHRPRPGTASPVMTAVMGTLARHG